MTSEGAKKAWITIKGGKNSVVRKSFESWLRKQKIKGWKVGEMTPGAVSMYKRWRTQGPGSGPDFIWGVSDPDVVLRVIKYCKENHEHLGYTNEQYYNHGIEGLDYYKRFLEQSTIGIGPVDPPIEEPIEGGKNIIFYGVPGSGKSYTIKKEIGDVLGYYGETLDDEYNDLLKDGSIVRVVFHPDYTYSDFIGQILPNVSKEGKVTYEFRPGPFTRILEKTVTEPTKQFFLIIEEINRGNAASIFGDLFQLLDRNNDGNSEYEVDNREIGKIVYSISDDNVDVPKIFIPKNLWIFATMNTSDQNVFPLDTAFQRRWEMELIPNVFDPAPDKQGFTIKGTGVTWKEFADAVNKKLEDGDEMMSGDKRLGAWFIKPDSEEDGKKIVSKKRFANKVLKYLWDDAFKFNREKFFNTKTYPTLEKVIDAMESVKDTHSFNSLFVGIQFTSTEVANA